MNLRYLVRRILHFILKPKYPNGSKVNIHLGCGEVDHPGFINVDARYYPHIHHIGKVDELSFFPDNFADLIYVSHCLEHIEYRKIDSVLKEWYRVLKKGGILRISVPDFDTIIKVYNDCDHNMEAILPPLYGGQDYEFNFHYVAFNEKYLANTFLKNGFENPREWNEGDDNFSSVKDWSHKVVNIQGNDYCLSLNIEATK